MHSSRIRTVCCSSCLLEECLPGQGGVWLAKGGVCLARDVCLARGCLPGQEGCTPPPWTEFMTHNCENITFPQLHLRTVMTRMHGTFIHKMLVHSCFGCTTSLYLVVFQRTALSIYPQNFWLKFHSALVSLNMFRLIW